MADNITLNSGSGGATLAADDIASVWYQRVKITYGDDGSATDVSDTNPLPIDDAGGSITVDNGGTFAVQAAQSGTWNIGTVTAVTDITNTVTVDNGGTFAVQVDGDALTALQTIDNSIFADDAAFTLTSSSVNMAGAIRDDALTTLTAIEGDAVPLRVSSTGALHVTGGGGGTEYTQDDAATDPATASTTLMVRDDSLSTQESLDGDWTVPRTNARGAQWVELDPTNNITETNSAAILADTANMDSNLGTMNINLATVASDTTSLDAKDLALGTDISDVFGTTSLVTTATLADAVATTQDVLNVRNFNYVYNGTTFDFVREGGEAGSILVDLGANNDVTVTGTVTVDLGANNDVTIDNSSIVHLEDAAHVTGDAGVMSLGVRQDTQADFGADGDYVPLSIDANGAVRVNAINADGTSNVDTAAGATDAGAVMLAQRDDALSSLTPADGDYTTVRVNDLGAVHTTLSGTATQGGTTLYKNIDVDESEDAVKATAGQVYWIHAVNLTAATLFLKFYDDTVGNVIVGTTVPDLTFPIPTQGDTNGAGFTISIPNGIAFGTAITIACTTGVADNDSGAPGANACVVNLGYA